MSAITRVERERLLDVMLREMERLAVGVVERCDAEEEWPDRIRHGLEYLLGELAAQPAMAETMARSFPALDPDAYERYVDLFKMLAPHLSEGRTYASQVEELPSEIEMLALGSAEAIIFDEIGRGRAQGLPTLLPAILFSVLVPFLGPEGASEAMRNAAEAA